MSWPVISWSRLMPTPSPGRVPLVYANSEHQYGAASWGAPGERGIMLPGESTSLRIQANGIDYRQGQVLPAGVTGITWTVSIAAREWNDQRDEGDFRTFKVTRPVGTSFRDVARAIESAALATAARPSGSTDLFRQRR